MNTALGRYRLQSHLGEGGMGDVYAAVVESGEGRGARVCVKVMKPALAANPRAVDLFLREARHAARLHHPKIVRIHELGREGDTWFLVMELLEGMAWHDIAQRCWRHGQVLPLEVIVGACADAADALGYAHELVDKDGRPYGIVHRDISPDNLFLTSTGVTRVLDFGIAKATTPDATHLTELGELRGKLPYMPPEQVKTDVVDGRADQWALGITLFYLATAQRPFDRALPVDTMGAILEEDPISALEMNPAVPPAFADVIARCLQKDPAYRWPSAHALRDALLGLLPTPPDLALARALLARAGRLERGDRRPLSALPAAPAWATWSRPPSLPASRPGGARPTERAAPAALAEPTLDGSLDDLGDLDGSAGHDDDADVTATMTSHTSSLATAHADPRGPHVDGDAGGHGAERTAAQPSAPRATSPPRAPVVERTTVSAPLLTADESDPGDDFLGGATVAEGRPLGGPAADASLARPEPTVRVPLVDDRDALSSTSASAASATTRETASSASSASSSSLRRRASPTSAGDPTREGPLSLASDESGVHERETRITPPAEVSSPSLTRRAERPPLPAWVFGLGAFAITIFVASVVVGLVLLLR